MKLQIKIFILITSLILAGCGGAGNGFAPSNIVNSPTNFADVSKESNFKYGESSSSSNGWEMSIDTTDPVQEIVLANGWNVEVM